MEFHGLPKVQNLIDQKALEFGRGIYGSHKGALQTARYFGFNASTMRYFTTTPEDVADFIRILQTQPILVTGQFHHFNGTNQASGHAVLAIGTKDKSIVMHDPHHRKAIQGGGVEIEMSLENFIDLWIVKHMGWALWLNKITPSQKGR